MSIASEIARIKGNITSALTAISNKGVTVPEGSGSDDLATLIGQIQTGGGGGTTSKFTARITNGGQGASMDYVTYDGTSYYTTGDSFVFEPGETMTLHAQNRGSVWLYVDGTQVARSDNGTLNYSYTLPSHCIDIRYTWDVATTSVYVTTNTSSSVSISTNGTHAVAGFETANVSVGGSAPNLQTKSVTYTPSSAQQTDTVTADSGYDGLQAVNVTVDAAAAGSVSIDTKTATATSYPVSLQFTGMLGEPKAFFLRATAQISSSGNTTYYYIVDMRYNGTNTTGNCFRIGSTRRVDNIISGYSWTYSGTTLTVHSSASSRSSSPGAFNNTYELVYVY